MRTKTLALSALLGLLGTASVMAQNVYSLNAVGYINVILQPGYNMISCPLICSPDNSLATLLPNGGAGNAATSNQYLNWTYDRWDTTIGTYDHELANAKQAGNKNGTINSGWQNLAGTGGTNTLNPGQAAWVLNAGGSPVTVTFVGTVPQNGSPFMTQTISPGLNMMSSPVPMDGDLAQNTNTLMTSSSATFSSGLPGGITGQANGDQLFVWDTSLSPAGYDNGYTYTTKHSWTGGGGADPVTANITQGFWYISVAGGNETWVENFSINP
jgi:hypothetical protein